MNQDRLKDLEKWAKQAVRDNTGNFPKLGESILELIAEVRRLRGWDGKIYIIASDGMSVVDVTDESKLIEVALSFAGKGTRPELYCATEAQAARVQNLFTPSQQALMSILATPPPPGR